jgi:hypothetical protein
MIDEIHIPVEIVKINEQPHVASKELLQSSPSYRVTLRLEIPLPATCLHLAPGIDKGFTDVKRTSKAFGAYLSLDYYQVITKRKLFPDIVMWQD